MSEIATFIIINSFADYCNHQAVGYINMIKNNKLIYILIQ